jgi:small-conductance mechanosensitive channel
VNRPTDVDPVRSVAEPVERALGMLIVGGLVSFLVSVGTVFTALFAPEGLIHEIGHVLLVGVMVVVVVARAVQILRRRGAVDPDAWSRARAVHPSDARIAELLIVSVPLSWLIGTGTILVHHVPALNGAALMIGAWLPMAAVLWTVATFAWHDICRDKIAGALDESDRRYRTYWQGIADSS